MSMLLNPYRYVLPGGFSSQAQAVFDRMNVVGAEPNSTRKGYLATFIDSVFSNAGGSKLDLLYLLCGHGDAESRINIVNPGVYDLTKVNTPSFTTDGGWTSAATSYLDSGFNPSTASGKHLAQNDVMMGVATITDVADSTNNNKYLAGVATLRVTPRNFSGNWAQNASSAGSDTPITGNTGKGLYGFTRSSSSTERPFKNGVAQTDITRTSSAITSANFLVLTSDGTNLTAKQITLAALGAGLTDTEWSNLWSAYSTYMTAIGVSPT